MEEIRRRYVRQDRVFFDMAVTAARVPCHEVCHIVQTLCEQRGAPVVIALLRSVDACLPLSTTKPNTLQTRINLLTLPPPFFSHSPAAHGPDSDPMSWSAEFDASYPCYSLQWAVGHLWERGDGADDDADLAEVLRLFPRGVAETLLLYAYRTSSANYAGAVDILNGLILFDCLKLIETTE